MINLERAEIIPQHCRTIYGKKLCGARAILNPAGKGKSIYRLKREISIYATDPKISECLADGVTDYLTNKSNAAVLSREIWQRLKEELS